jgi:hypothetical protein
MEHKEKLLKSETILEGDFTPIQRVLLTANGTVQRILSAFYNQPVYIRVLKHEEEEEEKGTTSSSLSIVIHREVEILVKDYVIGHATSHITVNSPAVLACLRTKSLGIAQVFQACRLYPEFKLEKADKSSHDFFRFYSLSAPGLHCDIHESFVSNLFTPDMYDALSI